MTEQNNTFNTENQNTVQGTQDQDRNQSQTAQAASAQPQAPQAQAQTQPQAAAPQAQASQPQSQPQHAAPAPGAWGQTQQIPAQPAGAYSQQQAAYQQRVYEAYASQAAHAHVKEPRAKGSALKTFGVSFAGAALAVVLGLGGFATFNAVTGNDAGGGTSTVLGAAGGSEITAADPDDTLAQAVAEKALPSIVAIDVYQKQSSMPSVFGFESPGASDNAALTQTSLGSGVVISSDGYIITNYHVVEGADGLKATVNGVEYDAEYVGGDSSSDIAVIKVDAKDLTAIEIGSSSDLEVGEWVMSLGSPFGLENSVSEGIVSALQRSSTMTDQTTGETVIYPNMIQTDATINPGNSGGALVDANGKLIGINSMIQSYSGSSSGVGFAIPIDYAIDIAQQVIDGKTPTHAQLGVSMAQINEQMAQYYGLATSQGVYVANVYEGSGAAEAGIEQGDIITAFDGAAVTNASDLQIAVREHNPGDTVDVTVNRNGEEKTMSVKLGSDENSQNAGSMYGNSRNGDSGNGYGSGNGNGYGFNFGF